MGAYLCHHGILGQKWGVRRFENKDGTLTEAGKKRYNAKQAYINSSKKLDEASKFRRSDFKIGGLKNRRDRIATARVEKDLRKADYAYYKARSDKAGERARKRQLSRSLRDGSSVASVLNKKVDKTLGGGYVQKMSKGMEKKYGKEYADKQIKKLRNIAVAPIAGTVAYTVGKSALKSYLRNGGAEKIASVVGKYASRAADARNGIIPDDGKWREITNNLYLPHKI